jgi:hypothetical protein
VDGEASGKEVDGVVARIDGAAERVCYSVCGTSQVALARPGLDRTAQLDT